MGRLPLFDKPADYAARANERDQPDRQIPLLTTSDDSNMYPLPELRLVETFAWRGEYNQSDWVPGVLRQRLQACAEDGWSHSSGPSRCPHRSTRG